MAVQIANSILGAKSISMLQNRVVCITALSGLSQGATDESEKSLKYAECKKKLIKKLLQQLLSFTIVKGINT